MPSNNKTANKPRVTWRRRVLACCLGILVALIVGELALRSIGFSAPVFQDFDPVLGMANRPGVEGWWRREGKAYVQINLAGMRDVERSQVKAADTLRIAVLGDSFVEAFHVDRESSYCVVLERELAKRLKPAGRNVEVLNFGCSGFGTGQELLMLKHRVAAYAPDVVLLAILTGNDIADNSHEINPFPRPYFRLHGDVLELDDTFFQSAECAARTRGSGKLLMWLLDHSRMLQLVNLVRIRRQAAAIADQSARLAKESGLFPEAMQPPTDERWTEAWALTERLLLEIQKECQRLGASLFVVTIGCSDQVAPDAERRARFQETYHVDDLFYADKRIAAWCDQHGVPCLMLPPILQRYAESHKVDLHGFAPQPGYGHWNELGHTAGAEATAVWQAPLLTQLVKEARAGESK
jgi:hypothetical protein